MSGFVSMVFYQNDSSEVIFKMIHKVRFDSFMKRGLVSFNGQAVILAFCDDLCRDLGLASHRVNRNDLPAGDFMQLRHLCQ